MPLPSTREEDESSDEGQPPLWQQVQLQFMIILVIIISIIIINTIIVDIIMILTTIVHDINISINSIHINI